MMASNGSWFSHPCLRTCAAILATVSSVAFAASSGAALITISAGGPAVVLDTALDGEVTDLGGGRFRWAGEATDTDSAQWVLVWDIEIDPDPFISAVLDFENMSGITQTVDITVTENAPIDFPPAFSAMTGSSAITVNDGDNSGSATMAAPLGGAIYSALIDGVVEEMLFQDAYSLITSAVAVDIDSFAGLSSQDLDSSLGIRHHFTITAGDKATANSRFEVVVPEPSTACLFGVCILGLGLRVRSRS